jgi:sec-independent protein translocase protein TatA
MLINSVLLGMFGGQELLIILVIVLLLFGGSKIPQLMRGLGRGMNEYNKAKDGLLGDLDDDGKTTPKSTTQDKETKNDEKETKN